MIGFMSVSDMTEEIKNNIHRIPLDIDLVVGIPRSGMIPAYLIALFRNLSVIDLQSFLNGRAPECGLTRAIQMGAPDISLAASILLVDDSLCSGNSIHRAKERILRAGFPGKITTCTVVIEPSELAAADIYFRKMPTPRFFEWNAFHHPFLIEHACMDLDGILCLDPDLNQNDDGVRYRNFISNAPVRFRPTFKIGHIVSARLEKYRALTESWLDCNGIHFGQLHLLDVKSAKERTRLGLHASFKAGVYARMDSPIFLESETGQAADISRLAGKPVLCTETMRIHYPPLHTWPVSQIAKWKFAGLTGYIKTLSRISSRLENLRMGIG